MFNKALEFLDKLQLSFMQWVLLTGAAVIGGLVYALRLQGSRLHRAQVDLLHERVNNTNEKDQESVKAARDRFNKSLSDYINGSSK